MARHRSPHRSQASDGTDPFDVPELPSLSPGVTLLDTDAAEAFHALVVDHVLMERETAWWIDTYGHAQTAPLADLAPSKRALNRIQVARAFTAYQHYTLCDSLVSEPRTGKACVDHDDVGLVVVPAIDGLYRDDDLRDAEGKRMLTHALARLAAAARRYDVPVLVSRTRDDAFAAPVERLAGEQIECEDTSEGARFVGDEFETLVYPVEPGIWQTTLTYWTRILEARQPLYPTAITGDSISKGA